MLRRDRQCYVDMSSVPKFEMNIILGNIVIKKFETETRLFIFLKLHCEISIAILKKHVMNGNLFILKTAAKVCPKCISYFLITKNSNKSYPQMSLHRLKYKRWNQMLKHDHHCYCGHVQCTQT